MKLLRNTVFFAVLSMLLLMVSTPSDQDLYDAVVYRYTGNKMIEAFSRSINVTPVIYTVNNYYFFKTVTNNITGKVVAHGLLFMIF